MSPRPFIYLASQSPRRAELLRQIGVPFELLLPSAGEDAESLEAQLPREAPADYVQRVTGLKLQAAQKRRAKLKLPPAPVLCADTTVALGKRIFGKPQDETQAKAMLAALSGREHRVYTALAMGQGTRVVHALSVSKVRFGELSAKSISEYVASGEPTGKAGGYAVQGIAAAFIAQISGSYSGIMGLPLAETAKLLTNFPSLKSMQAVKVLRS
jgi:septum formation protein